MKSSIVSKNLSTKAWSDGKDLPIEYKGLYGSVESTDRERVEEGMDLRNASVSKVIRKRHILDKQGESLQEGIETLPNKLR